MEIVKYIELFMCGVEGFVIDCIFVDVMVYMLDLVGYINED